MVLWSNSIHLDSTSELWFVSQELSWVQVSKWLLHVEYLCENSIRAQMSCAELKLL